MLCTWDDKLAQSLLPTPTEAHSSACINIGHVYFSCCSGWRCLHLHSPQKFFFNTDNCDVAWVACGSQLSHDTTASQAQSYIGQIFCPALLATPKGFGICNTSLMYTLWCNHATCNDKSSRSDVRFHQINPHMLSFGTIHSLQNLYRQKYSRYIFSDTRSNIRPNTYLVVQCHFGYSIFTFEEPKHICASVAPMLSSRACSGSLYLPVARLSDHPKPFMMVIPNRSELLYEVMQSNWWL